MANEWELVKCILSVIVLWFHQWVVVPFMLNPTFRVFVSVNWLNRVLFVFCFVIGIAHEWELVKRILSDCVTVPSMSGSIYANPTFWVFVSVNWFNRVLFVFCFVIGIGSNCYASICGVSFYFSLLSCHRCRSRCVTGVCLTLPWNIGRVPLTPLSLTMAVSLKGFVNELLYYLYTYFWACKNICCKCAQENWFFSWFCR